MTGLPEERHARRRDLGGGLAGVACAHRLGDEGVQVTLVDRNDYQQFQPLLYQVATSQLPAEDIARPHRTIFREHPTVTVRNTKATRIDPATRSLLLADGGTVDGSHLVIAAGGRPEYFGVPGAAEHAFPLYSVADAERLRRHVQQLIETVRKNPQAIDDTLDVVVVGGGAHRGRGGRRPVRARARPRVAGLRPSAGTDLPGRPRERTARRVLREVPRVRAQDGSSHQGAEIRLGHRRRRCPRRSRRTR